MLVPLMMHDSCGGKNFVDEEVLYVNLSPKEFETRVYISCNFARTFLSLNGLPICLWILNRLMPFWL